MTVVLLAKSDLLKKVGSLAGSSSKECDKIINALIEVITEEVASGTTVQILGIGRISTKDRPARIARNPGSGELIDVPAKTVPSISWSAAFKKAVNN